jgi:hypothetical protein
MKLGWFGFSWMLEFRLSYKFDAFKVMLCIFMKLEWLGVLWIHWFSIDFDSFEVQCLKSLCFTCNLGALDIHFYLLNGLGLLKMFHAHTTCG